MLNKNAEERLTIDAVIGCDWMQVNGQSAIVEASYGNADDFKEAVFSQLASLGVPTLDEEALSGEPRDCCSWSLSNHPAIKTYGKGASSSCQEKERHQAKKQAVCNAVTEINFIIMLYHRSQLTSQVQYLYCIIIIRLHVSSWLLSYSDEDCSHYTGSRSSDVLCNQIHQARVTAHVLHEHVT